LESTLLASGLGFPEGPAVMGDGRIVLCDGNTGELLAYAGGSMSTFAHTGGSPWGTVLGADGAIYVTQGGNVPGSGDTSAVSGIQRVMPDGTVELLFSEVAGHELYGPNDLAFGPDGQWGVVNTRGAGVTDLTDTQAKGTIVVITGLPDNPQFSQPYSVPMHSQGNIALSLDGGTLLLNDTVDRSTGALSSNQIIVQGIQPGGGPPRVVASSHFALPSGVTDTLSPVRDAKLTLDGRFVLAPVSIIRAFDQSGQPVAYNQIEILGPVRRGNLAARVLTETDGVTGGPYYAAISPDSNSALVVNGLDAGGAELLTGLASGDASRFTLKPLPVPVFGPPFPLGPNGPPVLAPHAPVVFTPDGKTALVENWVIPPLADSPLVPSISILTGFDTGKIRGDIDPRNLG
jgi:gluconolactonase